MSEYPNKYTVSIKKTALLFFLFICTVIIFFIFLSTNILLSDFNFFSALSWIGLLLDIALIILFISFLSKILSHKLILNNENIIFYTFRNGIAGFSDKKKNSIVNKFEFVICDKKTIKLNEINCIYIAGTDTFRRIAKSNNLKAEYEYLKIPQNYISDVICMKIEEKDGKAYYINLHTYNKKQLRLFIEIVTNKGVLVRQTKNIEWFWSVYRGIKL